LPIVVTNIELAVQGTTRASKLLQPGLYPMTVLPKGTATPPVLFDLKDDVYKTFQKPARLRVHYKIAGKD